MAPKKPYRTVKPSSDSSNLRGGDRFGNRIGGLHHPVHDPGLTTQFRHKPAQLLGQIGDGDRTIPSESGKVRYSVNFSRRERMIPARLARIMNVPIPTIRRKLRNVGVTGGRSSLRKILQPLDFGVGVMESQKTEHAWDAQIDSTELHSRCHIRESATGSCRHRVLVSQIDSMAANLDGWILAISTAWKSPVIADNDGWRQRPRPLPS